MNVFPVMDLMNGHVVELDARKHKEPSKIHGTPGQIADRWLKAGAKWLHVVDLNAALGTGMPNHLALLGILPKVSKAKAKIQWGGGVRDSAMLRMLLDAQFGDDTEAINRVVVGTRAVNDWSWLQSAAESYPDRIVVAIDASGRDILVGGWQEKSGIDVLEFVSQAKDVPIAAFLYTNVAAQEAKAVDWAPVKELVEASPKPVIFAGGISSLEDVERFNALKVDGIVLGPSLYSGAIDFAKAASIGA